LHTHKPVYILGTGLSHDGAACLLKDGKLLVAIEKERITRIKHDGGNDTAAIQYCLEYAGIGINDLSLVVQAANFEKEIETHRYKGARIFGTDYPVPVITISHHFAHAWSAAGTCPYNEAAILVIDGCGSFYNHCDDLQGAFIPADVNSQPRLYAEKDSYYYFDGKNITPLYKDFSIIDLANHPHPVHLPTSRHSIGGYYAMVSEYCFGNADDAGKLMGLAPYGKPGVYPENIFITENDRVWVNEETLRLFTLPANPVSRPLKEHFQYYADIARWAQDELERAVLYIVKSRLKLHPQKTLCYSGGVALNAVANTRILRESGMEHFYITPPAGDNGLALGCAFYGWMQVMNKEKSNEETSFFTGKQYASPIIQQTLKEYADSEKIKYQQLSQPECFEYTAQQLAAGKTIGWFNGGAELGPRALGNRSILADPRLPHIRDHINGNVKFREDFRPFAPAVLAEDAAIYFQYHHHSPHMILIDRVREEWRTRLPGVVHVNGTSRVQTVTKKENEYFYTLLQYFKKETGLGMLLNTSFNRKGMPIVETPEQALNFFMECALDILVFNGEIIVTKCK
jgi:carbamoyltransferase